MISRITTHLSICISFGMAWTPAAAEGSLPPAAVARFGTSRFRHDDSVRSLAFSADGKTLVSGGKDKTIRIWNVATGELRRPPLGCPRAVTSVAISPDGKLLAAATEGFPAEPNPIHLWDAASGKELRQFMGHTERVWMVAFSPDGRTLASGGDGVRLWDVVTGRERRCLTAED